MLIFYTNRANGFLFFRILRKNKGENDMANAKMITDLVGKNVKINDMILGKSYKGCILEIEDKWIKIDVGNPKKGTIIIKILAIDSIGAVDIL
jgi:hypothetical protein